MTIDTATVIQFLTTIGVGSVLLAVINAFFTRGARRADPAKTLIEGNKLFVDQMREDNTNLRTELKEVKEEQVKLKRLFGQALRYIEDVHDSLSEREKDKIPAMAEALRIAYEDR